MILTISRYFIVTRYDYAVGLPRQGHPPVIPLGSAPVARSTGSGPCILHFDGFFLAGRLRFHVVRAVGGTRQTRCSSAARLADDVRAADRAALRDDGIP